MIKKKVSLFIFWSAFVFIAFFIIPRKIYVKEIQCQNQNGRCSDRVDQILQSHRGQNMVTAKKEIRKELFSSKDDLVIAYRYPAKLIVFLYETEPLFAIRKKDQETLFLVDHDGYVLSKDTHTTLPTVIVETEPVIATRLEEKQVFGLRLMSDLARSYQLSEGILTTEGLEVELPTQSRILFPLEGDRDSILGAFVLVINQLNSVKEGTTMEKVSLKGKTIDLRFKNPVIR